MLLLVVDTSGRNGRIALARAGDSVAVIGEVPLDGGTFSAQLVPQIAGLLTAHGLNKKEIDAFVVASGPGSFTGLRVGLAAIKALAEILGKPIVPVSLLEAVARGSGSQGKVAAALDAGRGEVYVGEYEVTGARAQVLSERLLSKAELLSVAREAAVTTPDENLAAVVRDAGFPVMTVAPVGAAAIAELGWQKLEAGETVSPEGLEANYIRRTDAEIFAKPANLA